MLQNTYIDVIIDSVASVSEAKELSRDIDALLKMGSFYVKEWIISPHENSDCGEVFRRRLALVYFYTEFYSLRTYIADRT